MTQKSIRDRLENWGICQRGRAAPAGGTMRAKETRSASPYGGQGYKCMTTVVCNIMATQAPRGKSASKGSNLDFEDAKIVTLAWLRLPARPKSMLKFAYVYNSPPEVICRRLGLPVWPASYFKSNLAFAEAEIAKVLDSIENRNTIPRNNSFPSGQTCGNPMGGATVPGGNEEKALD